MAQDSKDKKGNKVKFIRKGGKVIPIRSKGGGSSGSSPKNKKFSGKLIKSSTKGRGLLVRKGVRKRILKSRSDGRKGGFAVGAIAGGGSMAYALSKVTRGAKVSKRGAMISGAIAIGGAALTAGGVLGGLTGSGQSRKQTEKEIRRGNIRSVRIQKVRKNGSSV